MNATVTQERQNETFAREGPSVDLNEIASATERKSALAEMAGRYGMSERALSDAIMASIMPDPQKNPWDQNDFRAFVVIANEYELNPFTKEIYAYAKRGGGIQNIVGIDGWCKILNRQDAFDGIEFEYEEDETGKLISVTSVIYRKDRARPVRTPEYFDECFRPTEPWKTMPRRMLRHKALMQGARYAFGISGVMDEEEGRTAAEAATEIPSGPSPKAEALRDKIKKTRKKDNPDSPKKESDAESIEEIRAKQKAAQEAAAKAEAEEAESNPATDSEPQEPEPPAEYTWLWERYESHGSKIDEILDGLGLPEWSEIDPADISTDKAKLLKRARAQLTKAMED